MAAGWVVVLNGAPRSGKSSIAAVIQETFDGPWMNLGVDVFSRQVTPPRYRPGIYDLEIDTSTVTPEAAAATIRTRLAGPPPTAFRQLAADPARD